MKTGVNRGIIIAWLGVAAITLLYVWIDHSAGALTASSTVTVLAICIALLKTRIIMRQFMEVRRSPQPLKRLTDLLIVLIAVALLTTYFAGKAVA